MTDAILCDGCETWQIVDVFSHVLELRDISESNTSHLCNDCAKMFWNWVKQIPKSEDA